MTILSGCAPTVVRIVKVDSFCEGKFLPLFLAKKDYVAIDKERQTKNRNMVDKYIKYHAVNEKEYDKCPK